MRNNLTLPVHMLMLVLVGTGLWAGTCRGQELAWGFRSHRRPLRPPSEEPVKILTTVEGWGEDEDRAKDYAVKKVSARVEQYLRSQVPGLEWTPSPAYIKKRMLREPAERRRIKDVDEGDKHVKCWAWNVAVSRSDLEDIVRRDTNRRVHHRLGILTAILIAVVALLAVVAGYIRLDDWTKGYYTGWLLAAAVGSLALVGSGLWLVLRS
jgi:hypothetical protein